MKLTRNKCRITVTLKKTAKVRLGFVLYRNRETSLEDSAPIEGFLSVWGFNGEQQRSMVATSGEESWDVGEGFWKKEGERNGFFPRLHTKERLQHSSAPALGKGSVSHTLDVISQIAIVRLCTSVLLTSRPNFEKIQRLTNAGGCFYGDSFR